MHELIENTLHFLSGLIEEYWLFWIFFIVFTESFIQPIPVDPLILASANSFWIEKVIFPLVFGTILGSAAGYFLGKFLWEPIFIKIFWKKSFEKWHKFVEKRWFWWVVIAGLTPIPYKAVTWIAGIFEMNFWLFILAGIIWRIPRFVLVYYLWANFLKIF